MPDLRLIGRNDKGRRVLAVQRLLGMRITPKRGGLYLAQPIGTAVEQGRDLEMRALADHRAVQIDAQARLEMLPLDVCGFLDLLGNDVQRKAVNDRIPEVERVFLSGIPVWKLGKDAVDEPQAVKPAAPQIKALFEKTPLEGDRIAGQPEVLQNGLVFGSREPGVAKVESSCVKRPFQRLQRHLRQGRSPDTADRPP